MHKHPFGNASFRHDVTAKYRFQQLLDFWRSIKAEQKTSILNMITIVKHSTLYVERLNLQHICETPLHQGLSSVVICHSLFLLLAALNTLFNYLYTTRL